MLGINLSGLAVLLLFLNLIQPVEAAEQQITSVDFCSSYAKSCLGDQTPSLPLLIVRRQQEGEVEGYQQVPELRSDDPSVMLPALRQLLQTEPTLTAVIYLPVDKDCMPCQIWRQAIQEWLSVTPELPFQLISVSAL
ncbi:MULTISPECIES: hypothetical protein [Rheinheimera]|uniref:hypothetical protein n=1 Tax=Rheinheimera TaxID=67575 RepID=UPI00105092B9|nr:hypothetical protein [Rheinheimera sp. D18]QBL10597.1 hypothetical protein E0Z06_14250 [Rheinheimera sp. D18]